MDKAKMDKEHKKMMAENDLRTLVEAERIKKDKTRYGAAMQCHAEQMQALAAIKGGKGPMSMKSDKKETY